MEQNIYLIIISAGIVGLSIAVRLFLARDRCGGFYESLLPIQEGLSSRNKASEPAPVPADDTLASALIIYFQQSFTSRQVMAALASSPDGVPGRRLEQQIVDHVAETWKRKVPLTAVRRVIIILMGANLVGQQNGRFVLTNLGWNLFLKTKRAGGPRWTEAGPRLGNIEDEECVGVENSLRYASTYAANCAS